MLATGGAKPDAVLKSAPRRRKISVRSDSTAAADVPAINSSPRSAAGFLLQSDLGCRGGEMATAFCRCLIRTKASNLSSLTTAATMFSFTLQPRKGVA